MKPKEKHFVPFVLSLIGACYSAFIFFKGSTWMSVGAFILFAFFLFCILADIRFLNLLGFIVMAIAVGLFAVQVQRGYFCRPCWVMEITLYLTGLATTMKQLLCSKKIQKIITAFFISSIFLLMLFVPKVHSSADVNPQDQTLLFSTNNLVFTSDGKAVKFPEDKPVLVFSNWCDYCDESLIAVSRQSVQKRPVLFCLLDGDMGKTVARAQIKLKRCGLDPEYCYYGSLQVDSVPVLFLPSQKPICGSKNIVKTLEEM
jgi:hypothetical protein